MAAVESPAQPETAASEEAAEAPAQPETAASEEAAEAPAQPEAPAAAKPEGDATDPAADEQSGRPRAGSKRNAKGRRSSVPSWDEIMLGSSRQRE